MTRQQYSHGSLIRWFDDSLCARMKGNSQIPPTNLDLQTFPDVIESWLWEFILYDIVAHISLSFNYLINKP